MTDKTEGALAERITDTSEQQGQSLIAIVRKLAALADGLEAGNSSAEEAAARLARLAQEVVG